MLRKALVVDDLEVSRSVFQMFLQEFQCRVLEARNGREGLDLLDREPGIDLIFLDINMPIMNGVEFMQVFSRREGINRIPVIIISPEGNEDKVRMCLAMGARCYLAKPFRWDDLYSKIEAALDEPGGSDHPAPEENPGVEKG